MSNQFDKNRIHFDVLHKSIVTLTPFYSCLHSKMWNWDWEIKWQRNQKQKQKNSRQNIKVVSWNLNKLIMNRWEKKANKRKRIASIGVYKIAKWINCMRYELSMDNKYTTCAKKDFFNIFNVTVAYSHSVNIYLKWKSKYKE